VGNLRSARYGLRSVSVLREVCRWQPSHFATASQVPPVRPHMVTLEALTNPRHGGDPRILLLFAGFERSTR
jgi:hypothetical protein